MNYIKKLTAFLLCVMMIFGGCVQATDTAETVPYDEFLTLTAIYPHSTDSFTQGLFFHNGQMYESAGLYGNSAVYKSINLADANHEKEYLFDDDIFAEGSVVLDGRLYVLTWQERCVKIFNPDTLELESTVSYGRDGWGLTTDGKHLIASDGSSSLCFMDKNLNDIKTITVTENGEEVSNINELEYIDGYIWANVWLTNEIIIIDKDSGKVVKKIDFSTLDCAESANGDDVLNGIAFNPENSKIYITGKRWNTLYEFEIK